MSSSTILKQAAQAFVFCAVFCIVFSVPLKKRAATDRDLNRGKYSFANQGLIDVSVNEYCVK